MSQARTVAGYVAVLAAAEGSSARAARSLGITTSQLLRFLKSDPEVWRKVAEVRKTPKE